MAMFRRTLAVATTLIFFGCGSSNSDGGAAGAPAGGAGKSGAPTDSAGAASGGSSNAGRANAGEANAGETNAGETNAGETNAGATSFGGSSAGGGTTASGGVSGGGSGDLPPLDPSADARSLSDSDKAVLCDWVNDKLGGYGAMFECSPGMTVMNDPSQAICISYFLNFRCEVTVADVTTCTLARAPSHACNAEFDTCHQLYCQ
ncbi:MAG TPA: hypothetical protein VFK05_13985 [Polyangiaceae bacterium]|nr:hypothetical protein [Polyangiaceae bacterium]